jgi:hypothetical protein
MRIYADLSMFFSFKGAFQSLQAVLWIRIGSGFYEVPVPVSGLAIWIRIQEGKNAPEKLKKVNKFHLSRVVASWTSFMEAKG